MKAKIFLLALLIGLSICSVQSVARNSVAVPATGEQSNVNDEVTLVASGKATDSEKATTIALRSAIEQAYGTFVSANTTILNDNLVKDEIVTISNGNIKSYEVLSDVKCEDGQDMVTVKATVCISKLVSYAKSKGASAEFAGATFAQSMKIKELYKQNEAKALENLLTQVKFMLPSCYDLWLSDIGEPEESRNSPNCYELAMYVDFKPNANTKVLCDLFLNTLKSLSLEESSRDQGSELRFIWVRTLNKEKFNNLIKEKEEKLNNLIKGKKLNNLIKEEEKLNNLDTLFKEDNFTPLSDIHIFIRNSDEFEERFWTQLENITTAFQYSFVITDNLGGKSYVEQKKHKEVPHWKHQFVSYDLVPYGCIESCQESNYFVRSSVDVHADTNIYVMFEEGFRMQIKLRIPKDDIAKYSKFDVSFRK